MVTVRDATEADLPSILTIINVIILTTTASWSLTPLTLEERLAWYRDRAAQGFPVLVADDGRILGFASFGPFRPWEAYRHTAENTIYVDEQARGRGVGTALLAELIARAERLALHRMIAGIEAGNAASIALHRKLGFEEVGRMSEVGRKFDRWLDLVFMQRTLSGTF